jgi:glycosyltransferase involved in cell wall biosynthesis
MQTHALALARQLWRSGHVLEVATYRAATGIERARAAVMDVCEPFRVHRVLSRLSHWHNLDLLEALARRLRPDLVYCSTVFYGELGARLGVPVVSRSVGNDVLRPWIAYPFRPLSESLAAPWLDERLYRLVRALRYPAWVEAAFRRRRRELMIASARKHSAVLANSEFTARILHEIGVEPRRVTVVRGGVDSARFAGVRPSPTLRASLGIPRERYVLMTACRLVLKKGVDFLVRHMDRIARRFADAHLLVVGDGPHMTALRRLAASSLATARITFAGRVPHDAIEAYYALADAFVLASRLHVDPMTGIVDAETMGRVLCEANAAGVPVLAARSGGIPAVIRHLDNGVLFEPDDADDLCAWLERVRGSPGLADGMVARGRWRARHEFDWSVVARAHERAFASAVR